MIMTIIRFIIGTIVCWYFVIFLGNNVYRGLKTGKINYKDSTSVCVKNKNPLGFWSLVVLFLGFVLMFFIAWLFMITDIINKSL